jgi:hypothetical protein
MPDARLRIVLAENAPPAITTLEGSKCSIKAGIANPVTEQGADRDMTNPIWEGSDEVKHTLMGAKLLTCKG